MANPTVTINIKEIGSDTVIANMRSVGIEARKLVNTKKRISNQSKKTGQDFRQLGRQMQLVRKSQDLAKKSTQRLSTGMRNLGSAAIFAVGPLSGIGARLVAFQAIASRTSISVAAFAAALATVVVIAAKLAAGMVRTDIEVNKIMNALKAATGTAEGARREFQFLVNTSRELSLNIGAVGTQFAQLAAAARGTSLAGKGVRDIFKAVSTASLVLGLSAEQTTGAIRALQQMISKGTVQAEELRGQLGERIPGAFQIAARAMGVTTRELGKMLEQGLVLAEDLLPLMAVELEKTFSPQVEDAVGQIGAAVQNLKTEFFLFFKLLEDNTGLVQDTADILRKMGVGVRVINDALSGDGLQGALKDVDREISRNERSTTLFNKKLERSKKLYGENSDEARRFKEVLAGLFLEGLRLSEQRINLVNTINAQGPIQGPPAPSSTFEQLRNLPVPAVDKFKNSLQDMRRILVSLADPNLSLEDKLGLVDAFKNMEKAGKQASKVLKSLSKDELNALRTRIDGTQRSMEEVRNTIIKLITRFMDMKNTVADTTKELEKQDRILQKAKESIDTIFLEATAIERLNEAIKNGEAAREDMLFQIEFENKVRRLGIEGLKEETSALLVAMQARREALQVQKDIAEAQERSFRGLKKILELRKKISDLKDKGQEEIEALQAANEVLKLRIAGLDEEARLMEIRNALEAKYGGELLRKTREELEKIIVENDKLKKKLEEVNDFEQTLADGFRSLGGEIASSIREGKNLVDVLINAFGSLLEKLLEVAIQLLIIGPLLKALGLPGGSAAPSLAALFGGFFGAAHGADFTVKGRGGTDTNLVPLALTAGERVQVTPAGGSSGEKMTVINFNFPNNTNVREFGESQGQIAAMVANTMSAASQSNN
jgi:tape measure domain-containing protein